MKTSRSVCVAVLASIGAAACTPGWQPFGHRAASHDQMVVSTRTYQDAVAALERQDFEGALLRFQSLSRSYRESPAALNGMAIAYAGLGDERKARFMFETALVAMPQDDTAIDGLNRLLARTETTPATLRIVSAPTPAAQAASPAPASSQALPIVMAAMSPSVVLLNGNGKVGIAGHYAALLARADITVDEIASADRFDYGRTMVRYRPGLRDNAGQVARTLGLDAELVESAEDRGDIVVVLGADAA